MCSKSIVFDPKDTHFPILKVSKTSNEWNDQNNAVSNPSGVVYF